MAVAETDFAVGVRNASKLFLDGAVVAFRQLTLDVRNQEILCIVGPSGCGKTTFLRCIAGLIDLSRRRDRGARQAGRRPAADGVAMVFQHFGLLPWKTVYENAAFGLADGRRAARRASRSACGTISSSSASPASSATIPISSPAACSSASGWCARSPINPSILLMDEPFAALDAQTREILQEELLR